MNLKDLPVWAQILIASGLIVVLAVVAQVVWLSKISKANEALEAKLGKLRAENNEKALVQKKLPELEAQIARLQEQLQQIVQILPTKIETDVLVSKIKSLADNFNLTILSIKPQKTKKQEVVDEYAFDFQVAGSYHSLAMFFEKLGKMERIVDVKVLKMKQAKKKGDNATILAAYSARTFVYTG